MLIYATHGFLKEGLAKYAHSPNTAHYLFL